jgi:hypothetical protein
MVQDTPSRDQDKFMLRLPDGLRERVAKAAKSNNRSMNSEIVTLLERTLLGDNENVEAGLNALATLIEGQSSQIEIINKRLNELIALLAPKDPGENPLSDLLSHLVMIGREQLTVAHRTIDALAEIGQQLPLPSSPTPGTTASNGNHSR